MQANEQKMAGMSSLAGAPRRSWRNGLIVSLVGLSVTSFVFIAIGKREKVFSGIEFDKRVGTLTAAVRDAFATPLQGLKFLPAFFEASDDVSRAEFETFVKESLRDTPGVYAFQWLPIVPHAERERYERAARADGLSDFRFRQIQSPGVFAVAEKRAEYLPIYYQEPFHPDTIGVDLSSSRVGADLLGRARQAEGAVASRGIRSERDPELGSFVSVHRAVYTPGEEREVRSLVNVLVLVKEIVELEREDGHMDGLHVALIDDKVEGEERVLFEDVPGSMEVIREATMQREQAIPFADRQWTLHVAPTVDSDVLPSNLPWIVLACGAGVSLLLGFGVAMASRVHRLKEQVQEARELGQYRLVEKVGTGGMGEVYRARHAMLRRPTAVKMLLPEAADEAGLARFEREVQMTSQLTHPNTVAIYDYGRTPEGVFYYAMEYLEGMSLEQMVNRFGPLPEARAIHFLLQVCGSLGEAHEAGLIHRDVKPANIMVCRRGGLHDVSKLVDFGLVKRVDSPGDPEITHAGSVTGTPFYIAPEAIGSTGAVDARSDLYTVGAVAYFLVTGTRVFESRNVIEVLGDHMRATPLAPSKRLGKPIAEDLEALILQCLEKDPADRPQTAIELGAQLRRCKDAGRWTELEAAAWWKEHRGTRSRRAASKPADAEAPTMAIDLKRRGRRG